MAVFLDSTNAPSMSVCMERDLPALHSTAKRATEGPDGMIASAGSIVPARGRRCMHNLQRRHLDGRYLDGRGDLT